VILITNTLQPRNTTYATCEQAGSYIYLKSAKMVLNFLDITRQRMELKRNADFVVIGLV
jgi:hypothetical protein